MKIPKRFRVRRRVLNYILWVIFMCILFVNLQVNVLSGLSSTLRRFVKVLERCPSFPDTFEENRQVVGSYSFNISETFRQKLNLDEKGIMSNLNNTPDTQIVFTSATSSVNFREIQGLIHNFDQKVTPMFSDLEFIIFDIGLKKSEARLIKKHCNCRLQKFPFKDYPEHLRTIQTNAWKPLLIQLLLKEYHIVIWVDASIRFHGTPLDRLIHKTVEHGIQVTEGGGSIAVRTHSVTFKALGETPCMFDRPELQSSLISMYRTPYTLRNIMLPWVSCALQYNCMDFDSALKTVTCLDGHQWSYSACHRFDQSVLGIILTRLFSRDIDSILFNLNDFAFNKRATGPYGIIS